MKADRITPARWQQLLAQFGIEQDFQTFDRLLAAYTEKHRHYHTIEHIDACLRHLDAVCDFAEDAAAIEMALWFHDAIYEPYKSGNEEQSAQWADAFLAAHSVNPSRIHRIHEHILATKHDSIAKDADSQLLVDIDLSILGVDEAAYAAFEKNVREEYKMVPGILFRSKRAEILQSFLNRPHIYSTDYFRERLEARARENLSAAIKALSR
jgi:predicted metal-dependent HD superfamily phosphohydrolase